jgi:hypothetical protein
MSQHADRAEQSHESHESHDGAASFDATYGPLAKDVFHGLVRDALAQGSDPDERARDYAERGKPDFTLAYLLAGSLADNDKREVLARAYDRRAETTEARAREFDAKFHRPFPLLFSEAANDRAAARKIRAGRPIRPAAERALPQL